VSRDESLTDEKKRLERRAARARASIDATVSEIKDTVGSRVRDVKETLEGVSDFRDQFAKEPVVWSLGTLAAGFTLGYTLGYGHRLARGRNSKAARLGAFADAVAEELSTVGNNLVMPRLDANMKQLFGVEFSSLLAEMKRSSKRPRRKAKAAVPRIERTSKRTKPTPQPRRG
jgi:hypothetical protein